MTAYLLAISIGPVQEFIAAGRRTSDLYAGSELVARIAREAAEAIGADAELIFPADPQKGAANKILAIVKAGDPAAIARAAEAAAKAHLRGRWDDAQGDVPREVGLALEPARQQIDTFLEFYSAWWPWDGADATYREARRQVERLLAGRKALRDFAQPQKKRPVVKSPLDPSRDSVISDPGKDARSALRLKEGEHLDAVSLLKRVQGRRRPAPSTADIAARAFLATRPNVREVLGKLPAGAVFAERRQELVDEGDLSPEDAARIARAVGRAEPCPYLAILQADGDGIGKHIDALTTPREHREFSERLAAFAQSTDGIVRRHDGHPVYSGGDDVLAFLPVHTALDCAAELARAFEPTGCTLSVGVAVAHFHEPLWVSLGFARAAEAEAKRAGGKCLHLALHLRGGEARAARVAWEDGLDGWRRWIHAFEAGLSAGFPYELGTLAREMKCAALAPDVVRAEAERVLRRKDESEGKQAVGEMADELGEVSTPEDLRKLAERLIVLRWLANAGVSGEGAST
ncbi:MAG: type III-B CRISPR-associated protein Cas10/Cmr2 [Chthonomonadales bacterium]|nr:type III-B CRISPR-associated protein Cas10/Cmr2 [Chthonomonadales bacterium]